MQSLQADQSPYNRKGVCYIVHVIGRLPVKKISSCLKGKDNIFLEKNQHPKGN